jgi:hypothetical protein
VRDLVFAVERAYVARAMKQADVPIVAGDAERVAAIGAVASRYLAVGTPRSIGLLGPSERSLEAHRTWFSPTDIRTELPGALAADIVCIHDPAVRITARDVRRGTHLNILVPKFVLDPELAHIAHVSRETPDLGALAAGLVDGRQLDEITIFLLD